VSVSSTLDAPTVGTELSTAAADAGLLYERYYDRIFGYCLYHLGSRDEAEDAAQTTFLWAFRGLRRGVVPRAEASWLFTIAQNACRARHRARGRKRDREVLSDPQVHQDLTAAPSRQHDELVGLEDALARMPELQRQAILLREWRGFSYREIAAELGLSGAAVETLIFRARRSLAELLAGRPAPKRARRFAFDAGAAMAAVKAFGTATAAKVAVGVAAVVLAVTIAGAAPQTPPPLEQPASTAKRAQPPRTRDQPQAQVSPSASPRRKEAPKKAHPAQPSEPIATPGAGPAVTPQPAETSPPLGQTVDEATNALPTVPELTEDPVGTATDTVDDVVETATDALPPPVADAVPSPVVDALP
jgi:RNA polymerase sigma-70 factor (ECF subfamily)